MGSDHTCGISVVVPSVGRQSCRAAVLSALDQTLKPQEVIVVLDGTAADACALRATLPSGVRVLATGTASNANVARNVGIAAASGHLIALLDDDDLWESWKLASQLTMAMSCEGDWLVAAQARMIGGVRRVVNVPDRGPKRGEDMGDYLFRRTAVAGNRHVLQTSTWLGPRHLFLSVPFDEGIRRHQDWDWLIRASLRTDLEVRISDESLVQYHRDTPGGITAGTKWEDSYDWIVGLVPVLAPRAVGDFIASTVHGLAVRNRELAASVKVLRLSHQVGRPGWPALVAAVMRYLAYPARRISQFPDVRRTRGMR